MCVKNLPMSRKISNPEEFHYDVIIVTSSLVTLATGYCVPWLYIKQTRIGVDKWHRIGNFPLLTFFRWQDKNHSIVKCTQNEWVDLKCQIELKVGRLLKYSTAISSPGLYSKGLFVRLLSILVTLPHEEVFWKQLSIQNNLGITKNV